MLLREQVKTWYIYIFFLYSGWYNYANESFSQFFCSPDCCTQMRLNSMRISRKKLIPVSPCSGFGPWRTPTPEFSLVQALVCEAGLPPSFRSSKPSSLKKGGLSTKSTLAMASLAMLGSNTSTERMLPSRALSTGVGKGLQVKA